MANLLLLLIAFWGAVGLAVTNTCSLPEALEIPTVQATLINENDLLEIPFVDIDPEDHIIGEGHVIDSAPIQADEFKNINGDLIEVPVSEKYTNHMAAIAGLENKEPDFTPFIQLLNDRISVWLRKIIIKNSTRAGRSYQAINAALKMTFDVAEIVTFKTLRTINLIQSGPNNNKFTESALHSAWESARVNAWLSCKNADTEYNYERNWNAITDNPYTIEWEAEIKEEVYAFVPFVPNKDLNLDMIRRITYRIAERASFMFLYDNLFDILDSAYYQQDNTWKVSEYKLLKILKSLEKSTGTTAVLLNPFTQVLKKSIDVLKVN
ncbi:MAG: hypothetical protein AB8G05_16570 [Oligoflexales bacterium]